MIKIDKENILTPKIEISDNATSQILLSEKNDPYTKGKFFRIHISGKGCDGFSYQTFFDEKKDDDFIIIEDKITIIMAPFTAFYSQNLKLDFVADFSNDLEGYLVENANQKQFSGKFWREKPEITPTLL